MLNFTTDQWVIIGLVFVLGLLVGMWATSGGRRKWKTRYNEEVTARKALDTKYAEREKHWTTQEAEWRDRDARREEELRARAAAAPVAAAPVVDRRDGYVDDRREGYVDDRLRDRHPDDLPHRRPGDVDGDGIPNRDDRRPVDRDRY